MKPIIFAILACALAAPSVSQETSAQTTSQAASAAAASKNWLVGRWQFDEEYTQSKKGGEKPAAPETSASSASQIFEKMKGATLVVTESDLTMTRGDGTGKLEPYTLAESSDANVLKLRQRNGEVLTFHREGDRIRTNSTGSTSQSLFFKKAQ